MDLGVLMVFSMGLILGFDFGMPSLSFHTFHPCQPFPTLAATFPVISYVSCVFCGSARPTRFVRSVRSVETLQPVGFLQVCTTWALVGFLQVCQSLGKHGCSAGLHSLRDLRSLRVPVISCLFLSLFFVFFRSVFARLFHLLFICLLSFFIFQLANLDW
jgi:hypothetical protein